MSWRTERLPEIIRLMAGRPRHEALRGYLTELLRSGFGAAYEDIAHEVYLLDRSGRIDALWGAIVIELKSDLRRELGDVIGRMPDYLRDAASRSPGTRPVTGIATDGATFIAYALADGALVELARHETDAERPDALMAWLDLLVSDRPDLIAAPRAVAQAFGRGSILFAHARLALKDLWVRLGADPEVRLKRELWDGLLREAYGDEVGADPLFLQHTYLAFVVKAIATCVLGLPIDDPHAMLSGRALAQNGIVGAVEADFFDWPLREADGERLVLQVAHQVARFHLHDVEADVLKVLYESLIDPDERHDLGEYYTPDWLAGRVTAAAIKAPLTRRVLDPACGSGTFLFHAIRRLVAAGREAGWEAERILAACSELVRGIDVHPVAVTLARVTWLLALGPLVLERGADLRVPVFLGDAMQWNLRRFPGGADVLVEVPGEAPLQIPAALAEDLALFEQVLESLSGWVRDGADPEVVRHGLARLRGVADAQARALVETYERLLALYRAGRNGIWTFIFRNLVRPVWLARIEQRADVLVGNPPWIVYRHLSPGMKDRLRTALAAHGLWVGGSLATHQDMFALFWARCAEFYLKPAGRISFVLPYAVLNAPVFAAIREGGLGPIRVGVTGGWSLEKVWPIFGAQSGSSTTSTCVLFGRRDAAGGPPATVERWEGRLAERDADEAQAARALVRSTAPWPRARTLVGASPYRTRFRQGATIVPRRFFVVEPEPAGRFGSRRDAPRMRGRVGGLDKAPWREVEPPRGPVEIEFLRPLILGETVAPFRLLEPVTAVIPLDGDDVLDARAARERQHKHLAAWLEDVEVKWAAHCNRGVDGLPRMTLRKQIDHMRKLSAQAGTARSMVLYAASGTRLSAVHTSESIVVEHGAYWAAAESTGEARYLTAILNSETVLRAVSDLQPRGEVTPRHFDNLIWTLPIPVFDEDDLLHRELAAAASIAEQIAGGVALDERGHFTSWRREIRKALVTGGIAAEIETLVAALLPP